MRTLVGGAVALALAAPAWLGVLATSAPSASAASTTTTTSPAPPVQGASHHALFLYVDTVQGSSGSPKPSAPCGMTNLFQQTQQVVFRMWGVNVRNGGMPLTGDNVKAAWVYVPGVGKIPLAYGTHGTTSYWTGAWIPTKAYPLGVVDFHVTVVTKAQAATATTKAIRSFSGVFSQRGLPASSRLTIN